LYEYAANVKRSRQPETRSRRPEVGGMTSEV
jgi:hypothetical protein